MSRRTGTGRGLGALTVRREATRRHTVIASITLFAAFIGGIGAAVLTQREEPADVPDAPVLAFVDPDSSPTPDPDEELSKDDLAAGLVSLDPSSTATGTFLVVPGEQAAPDPSVPAKRVRVEIEEGLAIDAEAFATFVLDTLNDHRSWGGDGTASFGRVVDSPDYRIVLASPGTLGRICASASTESPYGCTRYDVSYLSYAGWVEGAGKLEDPPTYRRFAVNHEVGHLLGKQHVGCPGSGLTAPIMQQQPVEVAPCVPNGWPFPDAEKPEGAKADGAKADGAKAETDDADAPA